MPCAEATQPGRLPRIRDLLPFPAALQSSRIDLDCATGTGVCTEQLEVWNSTGGSPAVVAEQLAQHLRGKGWPLKADGGAGRFIGCLPMRGVFRWADWICASTVPAQAFAWPADVEHGTDSIVLTIAAPPSDTP